MSKETTQKGKLGDLQRLLSSLTANAAELPHLEATRLRFAELLTQAQEAFDRQGVHKAAKQEASRELRTAITESERLETILLLGVKQHFGIRAEKLAEFGLQPFRGLKTKPADEEPKPSTPEPADSKPPAPAETTGK